MSEHDDKAEVLWEEFDRNTPRAFWDVATWVGSNFVAGSLDVADRKRIGMAVIESMRNRNGAPQAAQEPPESAGSGGVDVEGGGARLEPYSDPKVWNTPISSEAKFEPADLSDYKELMAQAVQSLARAQQGVPPGPCYSWLSGTTWAGPMPRCNLRAGHAGMHRSKDGEAWVTEIHDTEGDK